MLLLAGAGSQAQSCLSVQHVHAVQVLCCPAVAACCGLLQALAHQSIITVQPQFPCTRNKPCAHCFVLARGRHCNQCHGWLTLRKPLLPQELAVLDEPRTLAFCMAASWFAKGAVTARLLSCPNITVNAAEKRKQQPDFRASSSWRAPSAKSVHSSTPSVYLLQKGMADSGCGSDGSGSSSDGSGSGTDGEATAPASSGHEDAFLAQQQAMHGLFQLRQLTGADLRDTLQVGVYVCMDCMQHSFAAFVSTCLSS